MYDVNGVVIADAIHGCLRVHLDIDNNLGTTFAADAGGVAIPELILALPKDKAHRLTDAIQAAQAMVADSQSGSVCLEPFQLSRIYDVRCVEDVPGFQLKVKDLVPV